MVVGAMFMALDKIFGSVGRLRFPLPFPVTRRSHLAQRSRSVNNSEFLRRVGDSRSTGVTRHRAWLVVLIACLFSIAITPVHGDDWPQWRGVNRDGIWRETGVVDKFSGPELPIKWRVAIGAGYSGPTVAAGRVYVTDRLTKPKQIERIHCLDEQTGKTVWMHEYDCIYKVGYPAGPRANVTIDSGRAYALGAMGHFFCYDAASGKILWQHDLNEEYSIRMPIWGISASPLVEGNLVIVQIGGKEACLVAFDKVTGKEVWKALEDNASYAAPIMVEQAGRRVMVCLTGDNVVGLNAATGDVYWKHSFPPNRMVITISTPIIDRERLFITSFYDGSLMLRLPSDKLSVEQVWRRQGRSERDTDALHSIMATPLLKGAYLYGVDSYGELRCLHAETGDRVWEDTTATPRARWSNIHMVENGENIWMFNERGELLITRLSPKGFEEISRTKLIEPTRDQLNERGGVCWSHPAFANRTVFARNDVEIVAASLAK